MPFLPYDGTLGPQAIHFHLTIQPHKPSHLKQPVFHTKTGVGQLAEFEGRPCAVMLPTAPTLVHTLSPASCKVRQIFVQAPQSRMGRDLLRLWKNGRAGDVSFHFPEEDVDPIWAHSCLMEARFKPHPLPSMGGMRPVWVVFGIDSWVFRSVLYFIYTDQLPEVRPIHPRNRLFSSLAHD